MSIKGLPETAINDENLTRIVRDKYLLNNTIIVGNIFVTQCMRRLTVSKCMFDLKSLLSERRRPGGRDKAMSGGTETFGGELQIYLKNM